MLLNTLVLGIHWGDTGCKVENSLLLLILAAWLPGLAGFLDEIDEACLASLLNWVKWVYWPGPGRCVSSIGISSLLNCAERSSRPNTALFSLRVLKGLCRSLSSYPMESPMRYELGDGHCLNAVGALKRSLARPNEDPRSLRIVLVNDLPIFSMPVFWNV